MVRIDRHAVERDAHIGADDLRRKDDALVDAVQVGDGEERHTSVDFEISWRAQPVVSAHTHPADPVRGV